MSDKTQSFFAGSILTQMLTVVVLSTMSWVGYNASQVPVLETHMNTLNDNLVVLTNTAKETNKQLISFSKNQNKNLAVLSTAISTQDTKLKYLEAMINDFRHTHGGTK